MKQNNTPSKQTALLIAVLAAAIFMGIVTQATSKKYWLSKDTSAVDGDLVISVDSITETASFYPVQINGTSMEVLAVKAPDGTIRTAFNTCQVCFDSGRGYYEQQGDVLVCQNCGNRYPMSQVEVTRGGCNPVPIFAADKTVDKDNIIISQDFLTQASVIFENWRSYR